MNISGPTPADTAFAPHMLEQADVVVAMYHDQGLPVIKAGGFGETVNITLGLPIVRTSPAHGTAYEIAGKNSASPESMRSAIFLACDIFRNRKCYDEMNKDPLPLEDTSGENGET